MLGRKGRIFVGQFLFPGRVHTNVGLFRFVLLQPRVFALLSFIVMLRDRRKLHQMESSISADTWHSAVRSYTMARIATTPVESTRRMEPYYQVLSLPLRDLRNEKLLIIGPKNVRELLVAWLYGWKWKNIQGIDLLSLHPKIAVMNMEAMTFIDSSFDSIVMANTFGYAKDPFRCLAEAARVLMPGGRFVFENSYGPEADRWRAIQLTVNQIRQYLKELSLRLVYCSPRDVVTEEGVKRTTHVFSVQKRRPEDDGFDRVD